MFNWDEEEKKAGGNADFLDYAPAGEYKVKLDKVEVRDNSAWKSPKAVFHWQDAEYKYPSSVFHSIALSNPSFRRVHFRNIIMEFGVKKENAQKLIEQAEAKDDRDSLAKTYQAMFNRLAQKHPEVTIVVRPQMRDGKPVTSDKGTPLSESDFANHSLQLNSKPQQAAPTSSAGADDLFGGEEITLAEDEIPFI